MCGIAGIVTGSAPDREWREIVGRMTAAMVHRGPDADGFFVSDGVVLGHRRLAVIDLTPGANQPMGDDQGRFVVTFNGEIYNFRQIRSLLPHYPFRTASDTEVILAAFLEWGEASVERLKGQFAFAIWDTRRRRLFLARDRLGEKPLYYHRSGNLLAFASEIRALLASGVVPRAVSRRGLVDFLINESVRSPRTMIADMQQVPPGHAGWFDDGTLELRRYWNPVHARRHADDGDYGAVCTQVRRLLTEAIDGQLVSDVPVGAFLSGGIDSSAIVALMAERASGPVNTLSVTFEDERFNEERYSSVIARKFDTRHHLVHLRPQALLEGLPDYFSSVDAPSGDGPNTWVVSRAAKRAGLTVALSGVGGDELFAGYDTFRRYLYLNKYGGLGSLPRAARRIAASSISSLSANRRLAKAAAFIANGDDVAGFYELNRCVFMRDEVAELLEFARGGNDWPEGREAVDDPEFRLLPPLGQMSVLELTNYMQYVLLKDTDSMAMAHSLEVRAPFCDHDLVDYVLGVPDRMKLGQRPKQLLVDSLSDLLPSEIVDRPKMGFAFPWGRWIKGELREFCSEALASLARRDLLRPASLFDLWQNYLRQDGVSGWSRVWLLVSLEQWLINNKI